MRADLTPRDGGASRVLLRRGIALCVASGLDFGQQLLKLESNSLNLTSGASADIKLKFACSGVLA